MSLTPEAKQEVIKTLKKRQALIEKLEHNKKELRKLESMSDAETNRKIYTILGRSIRKGQSIISIQTTELTEMSIARIAAVYDVELHIIRHQDHVLRGIL